MSRECVLKCGNPCKSTDNISDSKWESLQSNFKNWSRLDKFGDLYSTIPWKDGPKSYYMHQTCYFSISSSEKLAKAEQRKKEQSDNAQCSSQTSVSEMPNHSDEEKEQQLPTKRLRSSLCGPFHNKIKGV